MPDTFPSPVETKPAPETLPAPVSRRAEAVAWIALAAFFIAFLPLFLRMATNPDVWNYQVITQRLLHGEAPEKELNVFCKPPMMDWVLAAIYELVGWDDITLRGADFVFLSAAIGLLLLWLQPLGLSQAALIWTALAMYAFYFSLYELAQCQPDLWMLVPALAGLLLRRRQVAYLATETATVPAAMGRAFVEGLCWGAACLFKPFVALPGLLCWLPSAAWIARTSPRPFRRGIADAMGLLAGGLFAAGVWFGYLKWFGGWDAFWQDYHDWHGDYFSLAPMLGQKTLFVFSQFFPWGVVHWLAIPLAVVSVLRVLWPARTPGTSGLAGPPYFESLLAGMYLGWSIQGNYIQYQFAYHLTPVMLLALALVGGHLAYCARWEVIGGRRWLSVRADFGELALPRHTVVFLLLCVFTVLAFRFPLAYPKRLAMWLQCWQPDDVPKLEDDLTCMDLHELSVAQWGGYWQQQLFPQRNADLARVAEFLKNQHVKDGELTAYAQLATYLYVKLPTKPSTRFHYLFPELCIYKPYWQRFRDALNASHQRFVVTDVREVMIPENLIEPVQNSEQTLEEWPEDQRTLPPMFPQDFKDVFPFNEPIVFRAGFYCVHKVTHPVKELLPPSWLD